MVRSRACRLWSVLFIALQGGPLLSAAGVVKPTQVEIISITPVQPGSQDLRITWEGSIPPYKLQVKDEINAPWRDATFHIYSTSYVVSNPLPGAFYRVRTIPDRTPPPPVRGFGAREVNCNQVRFTWDPGTCTDELCADNAGGSGLRGYRIYKDGVFVAEIPFRTAAWADTNVTESTTYQYWATAVDLAGNESPRSGTRVVDCPACDPTTPDLQVTLAWDANPEPDVTGYILRYGLASGNYTDELDVGNVTTNTLLELVSGNTYYFVVAAYNADGQQGDPSNEVTYSVP